MSNLQYLTTLYAKRGQGILGGSRCYGDPTKGEEALKGWGLVSKEKQTVSLGNTDSPGYGHHYLGRPMGGSYWFWAWRRDWRGTSLLPGGCQPNALVPATSNDYLLLPSSPSGLRPESQGVILVSHLYLEAFIDFTRSSCSNSSSESLHSQGTSYVLVTLFTFAHLFSSPTLWDQFYESRFANEETDILQIKTKVTQKVSIQIGINKWYR